MPLGPVVAKRMFGGYGLFLDERMFAIIADDVLYLKVDPVSEPEFAAAGSNPFMYHRDGKAIAMSYWRAPAVCDDDQEALVEWAGKARDAALRTAKPKRRRTGKK